MKRALILMMTGLLIAGCSVKKMAANAVGDALSGGGGVWMSDNDPQLIREAIPFGLKTNESLLEISPEHLGLLEATAQGFAAYAFLLKEEADRAESEDLQRARKLRARSSKLFVRGRDYALRGLDVRHPGFSEGLRSRRDAMLAQTGEKDSGLLYWAGASWAGALSVAKDNLTLIAEFPTAGALVQRVLDLDEGYGDGSAHEFFVAYEAGRPGGSLDAARMHYRRALELSRGERASVFLALAESVSVAEQDVAEFRALLDEARAIDPDAKPDSRLLNIIAQERADWLETQIPELFLVAQ
ncbi:MAG: TRAP transporter TatT component family protein [Alphaproteobacteria bacterium]|nr:TRAP transporter TatT component family protein [Alphaproteobacteria bacterium]